MSEELLEIAVAAARPAGALLLERFRGPATGLSAKTSRTDLVSDADRAAEALIVERIRRARPGDAILASESVACRPPTVSRDCFACCSGRYAPRC